MVQMNLPEREINGLESREIPELMNMDYYFFFSGPDNFTGTIKYHLARHSNTELLKIYKYNITW